MDATRKLIETVVQFRNDARKRRAAWQRNPSPDPAQAEHYRAIQAEHNLILSAMAGLGLIPADVNVWDGE